MGSCLSKEPEHVPQKPGTKIASSQVSSQPTAATKKAQSKTSKPPKVTGKGHTLSEGNPNPSSNNLNPREAAMKAAEERANAKKNGGKLSKDLQKERAKSNQQHLKELGEQKASESKRIVYD